jgi:hypothetical protein
MGHRTLSHRSRWRLSHRSRRLIADLQIVLLFAMAALILMGALIILFL